MPYGVKLHVWGEYACFTRPEMKVERVSYDAMTPSAARGILEAIYWKPAIRWLIDRIHVLKPIRFENLRPKPTPAHRLRTATHSKFERGRKTFSLIFTGLLPLAFTACVSEDGQEPSQPDARPQAPSVGGVQMESDDIGGTVAGPGGPEAGVWVIAETRDLGTRYAKIVVTDDQGQYVIPDLPQADYDIWVRGYGLVDSEKIQASPGVNLDLAAVPAPNEAAAAHYYPAGYWFSLLEVPTSSEFPGTGPAGNGISSDVEHQADFIRLVTSNSCLSCHQMGNEATREIPALFSGYDTSADAWARRILCGSCRNCREIVYFSMDIVYNGFVIGLLQSNHKRQRHCKSPSRYPPVGENKHETKWNRQPFMAGAGC